MAQVHVTHSNCSHPKTPKARAVCRRQRRGNAPEATREMLVARAQNETKRMNHEPVAAPADLQELPTINDETLIPGLDNVTVGQVRQMSASWTPEACEQDDAYPNSIDNEDELPERDLRPTTRPKGSKTVHRTMMIEGINSFTCTKKPITASATLGWENDDNPVTCKNCLKIK